MKKSGSHIYHLILLFLYTQSIFSQELFPTTEPASNIPKGVIGLRTFAESYKEGGLLRNMGAIRLMYGLSSKLSVYVQGTVSNHHDSILPADIITHKHIGNQTIYYTQNRVYGTRYPYSFNGGYVYAKYRFYSKDEENKHLRVAVYAEASKIKAAHDEAEPTLTDDCSGWGAGLIVTQLYKRFAASLTTGYIKPDHYSEFKRGYATSIYYGNALVYNLSFGYRIYPKKYISYYQDNYNIYVELMGKSYAQGRVFINGESIPVQSSSLKAGNYLESHFGIQRIINSNTRLDFTMVLPFLGQSFVHFYPLYTFGWQYYFYPRRKK